MLYLNYLANVSKTPQNAEKYLIVCILPQNFNLKTYSDLKPYPSLAPSRELLLRYKNGNIQFKEMEKYFIKEIQTRPDTIQAINKLVVDLKHKKDICLICYEEDSSICHRKIIADYLKNQYSINYIDIKKKGSNIEQLSLF